VGLRRACLCPRLLVTPSLTCHVVLWWCLRTSVSLTCAACALLVVLFVATLQSWEALVRIVTSPTPFLYRHLLATLVFIFVFTFPFGFVNTLGVVVIPASVFMCFGLYVPFAGSGCMPCLCICAASFFFLYP
jgi:hypothetical protein